MSAAITMREGLSGYDAFVGFIVFIVLFLFCNFFVLFFFLGGREHHSCAFTPVLFIHTYLHKRTHAFVIRKHWFFRKKKKIERIESVSGWCRVNSRRYQGVVRFISLKATVPTD